MSFPWVEMFGEKDGEVHNVKCVVCFAVVGNDFILGPKSNTLKKHTNKRKATMDLPHLGVKKDDWFINKRCQHLKNATTYMNSSCCTIIEQVQAGLKGERGKKQQQFATIFHLFQQGQPIGV
jgi:hypothetical protein